jgi:hypothetical protein
LKKRYFASLAVAGVAALSLATAVWAGVLSFGNPVPDTTCGNPGVAGTMGLANYFATHAGGVLTVKSCSALCKATAAQCKRAVAGNIACFNTLNARNEQFADAACEADTGTASDAKQCKLAVHNSALTQRDSLHAELDSDLADCTGWGLDCLDACQALGAPT